jgi:hypothetical protein
MSFFDEAMAYGYEREMEVHQQWNRFVRRQKKVWSPADIFDRCCVKWLVYGKEDCADDAFYDPFEDELNDGNIVGKGCDYCELDHPAIALSFDKKLPETCVAVLSHPLKPFVTYMEKRVAEKTAIELKHGTYRLDGNLQKNLRALQKWEGFGKHLVTCKKSDLAASAETQKAKSKSRKCDLLAGPAKAQKVEIKEALKRKFVASDDRRHPAKRAK